ncbi:type II secretion system protein M [Sphingomonas sp. RS6]
MIRSQLPTLDAGITRTADWWQARSPRERLWLAVLGALLAGVVLVYGVIKPIQAARAAALADIRTYDTLIARTRAAGTLGGPRVQRRTGDPATIATQSAAAFGVAIATTPVAGGVRATVADASYDSLLAWLNDVAATSDLRVRRVSIERRGAPGRVGAMVEFGQ